MHAITEKKSHVGPCAQGHDVHDERQRFVVEEKDIGTTRHNFRGSGYSQHTFRKDDVGRIIEVITIGTEYTSWYFMQPIGGKS